jgi:leucyl aminopeptidase
MIARDETTRPSYVIVSQATMTPLLAQMEETRIAETIGKLSSFVNRYYTSVHGIEASNWLRETWKPIAAGHQGITVSQFAHANYGQQSGDCNLRRQRQGR